MSALVPSVRITNIYLEGGPNTDISVTGPTGGPIKVAPGMSQVFPLTPAITAIATVAGNSGGAPTVDADIG